MFSGVLISVVIVIVLFGLGIIYFGQILCFICLVKFGDDLKVELEVFEKLLKNCVCMVMWVFNQVGKQVVDGEVEIMVLEEKFSVELVELLLISIG